MSRSRQDPERLLYDAQWGIRHGFPKRELRAMLEKLIATAPAGSPAALYGERQLAALIVEDEPWRAARLSVDVLRHGDDELALGVLGLAHTLLGNYRAAARAYVRASALAPECPILAHNLGHLLDVALDRPHDALPHLERAHATLPHEPEIAASLAHALARTGAEAAALALLSGALGEEQAAELFEAWAADIAVAPAAALSG